MKTGDKYSNIKTPTLVKDLGRLPISKNSKYKARFGLYKCSLCGTIFKGNSSKIKNREVISCGCLNRKITIDRNTKHGYAKERLYKIWKGIKNRCYNKNVFYYHRYGGRGIKVCSQWKDDYISFRDWAINNGYSEELTIDRIDNDKEYSPSNCRWTTRSVQAQNREVGKDNTTGYKGVTKVSTNKYLASICYNGHIYKLGYYDTAESAGIAYNNFIIENKTDHILNKI